MDPVTTARRRRVGLRTRVITSFALLSGLLSALLGGGTWSLVRSTTIDKRETIIANLAFSNARLVREQLLTDAAAANPVGLYTDFLPRSPGDGTSVLRFDGKSYYASSSFLEGSFDPDLDIPGELAAAVADRRTVVQRIRLKGTPVLLVGVPLRLTTSAEGASDGRAWAEYYEVASLDDIEQMLQTLLLALLALGGSATVAGALLGRWASRRVLAPLGDVNQAVQALAQMADEVVLPPTRDPDLAPLVSSFNAAVVALRQRIERDGRFASDVSHELRSPLTTLTSSIAVLEQHRQSLPAPARQAVELLRGEFERFQQLVGDLLEISRFDAGAQHLQRSPLIVGEFIRQAARLTGLDDVEITVPADLEEAVIMADKRRLVQVLSNLVGNAEKYADGVTEVEVVRVAGGIEIRVSDRGPGISAADRERVFDRFARGVTAGNRRKDQGTGLGLALVSEHVRLHGGTITVQDRSDGRCGACFVIFLPATPVSIYDTDEDFEAAGIGAEP